MCATFEEVLREDFDQVRPLSHSFSVFMALHLCSIIVCNSYAPRAVAFLAGQWAKRKAFFRAPAQGQRSPRDGACPRRPQEPAGVQAWFSLRPLT